MTYSLDKYRDTTVLYCVDTNESEVVGVTEFVPNVSLAIETSIKDGSRYRSIRFVLAYVQSSNDYQTMIYGRTFRSRGPRAESGKKMKQDVKKFQN